MTNWLALLVPFNTFSSGKNSDHVLPGAKAAA
jgi:hypothetical protein